MSELRRWSEEGATSVELALVEASRREEPPDPARARVLGALGVGVTMLTSTSAATATTGGAALLTKVVAITFVVGGASAGGLVWRETASRPPSAARTAPVAPRPRASQPAPASSVLPPAPLPSAEEPGRPPTFEGSRVSQPRPASSAAGTLAVEVEALKLAHGALAARDFEAALRALDRYHERFPRGELGAEETVLRVEVLLARGNRAEAAAMADAYSATHPESPYARRMQRLVRDTRTP